MKQTINPVLKQMLAEISTKTTSGRLVDVRWKALTEAEDKPLDPKSAEDDEKAAKPAAPEASPEKAAADKPDSPEVKPDDKKMPELPEKSPTDDMKMDEPAEDAEEVKADAEEAKAELEKAKAEKERAEQEIADQSYVKLGSNPGVQFLLGKVLDHAFKTNTIDSLAGEMVQKLKIQSAEEMANFNEDTAMFKSIPGMAELTNSMQAMVSKEPKQGPSEKEPSLREMFNRIKPLAPIASTFHRP